MINQNRLINTFFDLVRIDSPTGGEREAAAYVAEKLRTLGATASVDEMYNVTGFFPGEGEPILLSAHMDSVAPCLGIKPRIKNGVIRSDGTTVLGGDARAGLAGILEALAVIHETGLPHLPIQLAITAQEEPGLKGAQALDYGRFTAKWGVVFDCDGPVGTVIVRAPGANYIDAAITGRAAHAGAAPERGINAIVVAAEAISAMQTGRLDHETTANIGGIRGGAARNVVAESCEVTAETRSLRAEKLARQTEAMIEAFESAAARHHAQVEIRIRHAYQPFCLAEAAPIVRQVSTALERIGRTPVLGATGGGSDANEFNQRGIACVVVSTGVEQMHSTEEYVPVAELVKCAELALGVTKPIL